MNKDQLIKKCQENIWLKRGGVMFEDDPCAEFDYNYEFGVFTDQESLKEFFLQGNWAIRQGVIFGDLAFINQVNAGDEWWTLKEFNGELVAFESISFLPMIQRGKGEFENLLQRLAKASKQDCLSLNY